MADFEKMEQQLSDLIEKNDTAAAMTLLLDLVTAHSKAKNFTKAEAMRDRMFEVDSMALNEIIQSAEIIEREKSAAIDVQHREIWQKLYETFSQEEGNALYFGMQQKAFDTDKKLFSSGDFNSSLYFIDQGKLKLVYQMGDKETLLKSLSAGDIAGEDTFFASSVCTSSLITMSQVNLNYMERKVFDELENDFPGLGRKLQDYCLTFTQTSDLIKSMGLNRRVHKRIAIEGIISFQLINSDGSLIGNAFKGKLADISRGGISFFIRSSNPKNARILLGRKLHLQFILNASGKDYNIQKQGMVIGVIFQMFNNYSIHIKFQDLFDESLIERL